MTDTAGNVTSPASDVDKALSKFESMMADHKNATLEEIRRVQRDLSDALEDRARADKTEKEELRAALAKAQGWIDEEVQARAHKDDIKDGGGTLVIPPDDVQVTEPVEEPEPVYGDEEQEKKSRWKKIW